MGFMTLTKSDLYSNGKRRVIDNVLARREKETCAAKQTSCM